MTAEHGFPYGGITNWEIAMLERYGRLGDAILLQGKTVVANPFAGG